MTSPPSTPLIRDIVGPVDGRGQALCLGLAYATRDRLATIYLDLAGPPTAVAAVRSLLSSGASVAVLHRGRSYRLRGRELERRGPERLPGLQWDHLLLLDPRFHYDPDHDHLFLLEGPHLDAQAADAIRRHVRLPVLAHWVDELPGIARKAKLLQPAHGIGGGQRVWSLNLDRDRLEEAIARRVKARDLTFDPPA